MSTFFKSFNGPMQTFTYPWGAGDPLNRTADIYTTPANRFAIAQVNIVNSTGKSSVYNLTTNVILDSTRTVYDDSTWVTIMLSAGEVLRAKQLQVGTSNLTAYVYEFYVQSPV